MHVTAIIAAGGRGTRFGPGQLKQLLPVGGRAILDRSVMAFLNHPAIADVIVALPSDILDDLPAYLRVKGVRAVAGGSRRQDSVANAFHAASGASDVIVIHDAARPFASADLITRTIAAAAESGAAVAAVQSRDTVKRTAASPPHAGRRPPDSAVVAETLPRETIYLAQTPQAFRRDVLAAALAQGQRDGLDATDEAALAERAGFTVRLVDGEATNIKITTPADAGIADAIVVSLEQSAVGRQAAMSVGTGYDLHRLVDGRALIVGGVTLPSARGALGHSDADVACHAVVDAILGAASLGDIGSHFPDSDPRWKGASGVDLITRAAAAAGEAGHSVANVDVTVILEAPKIREHVDAMRQTIAAALGIDVACVSVKGKTNEGVDAVGRGEAIAAHAVVLLYKLPSQQVPESPSPLGALGA